MAKQIEERDRFRISAEVESAALGPLFAQLARMGLQDLRYELITDVMRFKTRVSGGPGAPAVLRAWLPEHPTFTKAEAVAHAVGNGCTAGAVMAALVHLVNKGEIIRTEPGHYRRVDAALPPPNPALDLLPRLRERKRIDGPRIIKEVSTWNFIAKAMKGKNRITSTQLSELFVKDGRNPKSISPVTFAMAREGFIKKIGDGEYQILKPVTSRPSVAKKAASTGKPNDRLERDRQRAKAYRAKKKAERAAAMNGQGAQHA
jgi:hypothetical protein